MKVLTVMMLAMILFAPLMDHVDCEHDHDTTIPDACVCICHGAADLENPVPAVSMNLSANRFPPAESLSQGRLSSTDIYRPPAGC